MEPVGILFVGDDRSPEEWGVRLVEDLVRRLVLGGRSRRGDK